MTPFDWLIVGVWSFGAVFGSVAALVAVQARAALDARRLGRWAARRDAEAGYSVGKTTRLHPLD